jgi:hypothetical protein
MTATLKKNESAPELEEAETSTPQTRDELRARIFGSKPKSVVVDDFYGATVEIRQPTLKIALQQRHAPEEERVFFMLTDYAFVPGTDEKLFEPGDVDSLRELPFGGDFTRLMEAINTLLGIKPQEVDAAIKEAEKSA